MGSGGRGPFPISGSGPRAVRRDSSCHAASSWAGARQRRRQGVTLSSPLCSDSSITSTSGGAARGSCSNTGGIQPCFSGPTEMGFITKAAVPVTHGETNAVEAGGGIPGK
ncbi:hypothetical protein AAFF_G00153410 [Aldrovandia affinis]|uniref:Uncharacterized protein n=1 Tax=Aldrovandia affinis TaxID=143900 RepID=A0AAD7WWM4_9TELE|nr:hypothetical protein AAFF_G00153410 [Aldrovandia affinis]